MHVAPTTSKTSSSQSGLSFLPSSDPSSDDSFAGSVAVCVGFLSASLTQRTMYTTNIASRISPTGLLKFPVVYAITQYIAAEIKKKITGTVIGFLSTFAGLIAMVSAAMSAVLQMIDPNAFPYASCPCPCAALVADTITSGSVVPIDTTVAPIRTSGILNLFAIPQAPSTNQSPPLIRSNSPTMKNNTANTISASKNHILMLTHLPCRNLTELKIYLDTWSASTPIQIPVIPHPSVYPPRYEKTVLMSVTLTIDAIAV